MARPPPSQASSPCELCRSPAHVLCPSDDAFLCWRCDSMVHSANFLVARHYRTYLCICCACPTTMVACGAFLPSRSQLCARCSIFPTEDCCSTGSESNDSECSELTFESDAESLPTPGSCRSQSFIGCFKSRRKRSLELLIPNEKLDVEQDSEDSDGMSGVEDELSSTEELGALSPTSNMQIDPQESAGTHGSHGRSFCRFSKA